ncbi:MAG: penicillin acylase family protein [Planctomycetia bacterium]|nr:penicillin acylase family protein [Planctomycetia bacterium]
MHAVRLKYDRRGVRVARDDFGVPHIQADAWPAALYGLGYMHAVDRLTQMLFSRVVAQGRSAEQIAGTREMFEADCLFRQVGLYLRLDEELFALEPAEREDLAAYCEGVNDGLHQAGRSLPMWATRFQPDPWDERSVLLAANLLNFAGLVIAQQQQERLIIELVQAGVGDRHMRELFSPALDGADFDLLRRVLISSRLSDDALQLIADLPHFSGSNAWAISPARSETGSALLASDPHLEINRLPAIWYEAVLTWPENYLLGATLPGTPICAVGRSRDLAWGVTYLKGDTSDFFVEDCRRHNGAWQYRRRDGWHDFSVREETIHRRGKSPVVHRVYSNSLGALDGDPAARGEGLHLLPAWTGQDEGAGRSVAAWLKLVHVRKVAAAMDLVRDSPQPSLCWIFADRAGHIGRQASGTFPLRAPPCGGLYPIPAWDEMNHWQGRISPQLLPRLYDPPEGFVASANEPIEIPSGPTIVTMPLPDYRKRRIVERLTALPKISLANVQALQYDVVSLQARELMAILAPHLPEGELKWRLAAWDHSYPPDSREATLFTNLYRRVLVEIFGQEPQHGGIGWRRTLYLCTRAGFSIMIIASVDKLLHQEKSVWWEGRDKGELIRKAAENLSTDAPPWSKVNAFRFTNRFFERKLVARALGFHTRLVPMPGCFATPFQGNLLRAATRETSFAPSYHFVTDLATDEAHTNLPGGPSESRFSRWYKSDIPRWFRGQYKPLRPST